MNRDDIIRLVQEAEGRIEHIGTNIAWFEFLPKNLELFATLVAATAKEEAYRRGWEAGETVTRDACIALCEEHWRNGGNPIECADAIRAGGEK